MKNNKPIIAYVSTFPPTQCGIATYTNDLIECFEKVFPAFETIRATIILERSKETKRDKYSILSSDYESCKASAIYLNSIKNCVINLQHEFKLFGGYKGANVLALINNLSHPLVTTFHTVKDDFDNDEELIFQKIADRSDKIMIFSQTAKLILEKKYSIASKKIQIIPHGIPELTYCNPKSLYLRKRINIPLMFVSAGHFREGKGIETALNALGRLKDLEKNFKYFILGSNHPRAARSKTYREEIKALIINLKLQDKVVFVDKYLSKTTLINYIRASDICLVPYSRKEQSSSGILSLMIGCGRPIVTTDFQFAKSVVKPQKNGIVVKIKDVNEFCSAIEMLIKNHALRKKIGFANYITGKKWSWKRVSMLYFNSSSNLLTFPSVPTKQ